MIRQCSSRLYIDYVLADSWFSSSKNLGGVTVSNGVYKNDIWFTADGVNWTEATAHAEFPERIYHTTVVYDNKLWVIGGAINSGNQVKRYMV